MYRAEHPKSGAGDGITESGQPAVEARYRITGAEQHTVGAGDGITGAEQHIVGQEMV